MPEQHKADRSTLPVAIGLLILWVATILIIDPRGEFPLNDDWAYTLPMRRWVNDGQLRFTDWQSMPLIGQLWWGRTFCVFGFSFSALRASTLVLGYLGGLGLYHLCRQLGAAPGVGLVCSLSLLVNPIYVSLACTFMTDVPFFCMSIWSLFFLCKAVSFKEGHNTWFALAIGTALAVLASLTRQLGLGLGVAFFLITVLNKRSRLMSFWPILASAAALFFWEWVLRAEGELPSLYHAKSAELADALSALFHGRLGVLRNPVRRTGTLLLHAGFFGAPFLFFLGREQIGKIFSQLRVRVLGPLKTKSKTSLMLGLLSFVCGFGVLGSAHLIGICAHYFGFGLPQPGNALAGFAVGPLTLDNAELLADLSVMSWWLINTVAVLGAVALLTAAWYLVRRMRTLGFGTNTNVGKIFVLLFALLLFVPFAIQFGTDFDRYYLAVYPLFWVVLTIPIRAVPADIQVTKEAKTLARFGPHLITGTLLSAMWCFTVAATHDYFVWNRARWDLARELVDSGVGAQQIDGGFEWNNYVALRDRPTWHGVAPILDELEAPLWQIQFARPEVNPSSDEHHRMAHAWLWTSPQRLVAIEVPSRREPQVNRPHPGR